MIGKPDGFCYAREIRALEPLCELETEAFGVIVGIRVGYREFRKTQEIDVSLTTLCDLLASG